MNDERSWVDRFFSWYLGLNEKGDYGYESSLILDFFLVVIKLTFVVLIVLLILQKIFDSSLESTVLLSSAITVSLVILLFIVLVSMSRSIGQRIDGLEEKLNKPRPKKIINNAKN